LTAKWRGSIGTCGISSNDQDRKETSGCQKLEEADHQNFTNGLTDFTGATKTEGDQMDRKKLGLSEAEYREGLLKLLGTAPTPNRKEAVLVKLAEEISSEKDADTRVELEQRVARSREAYARAAWAEFDNKTRLLSDEGAVELIRDHARRKGLDHFAAYKDLLSPAPDEPRPVPYTNDVMPGNPETEGEVELNSGEERDKEARISQRAKERFAGDRRAAVKELLRRGGVTI
jgi:hypothetical protein